MRIGARQNWPFEIIEEEAVSQRIVEARNEWPRFDEIWDGLVWLIAHGGHKIGTERNFGGVGHRVYVYAGDEIAGFPRIVVVYRHNVESFTLRMIVVSKPIDG